MITWEPLPDYGELFSIDEFNRALRAGLFNNYDGHGYYATKTHMSTVYIAPSKFSIATARLMNATHVMWFNK